MTLTLSYAEKHSHEMQGVGCKSLIQNAEIILQCDFEHLSYVIYLSEVKILSLQNHTFIYALYTDFFPSNL